MKIGLKILEITFIQSIHNEDWIEDTRNYFYSIDIDKIPLMYEITLI
jgi:hypothetical protein